MNVKDLFYYYYLGSGGCGNCLRHRVWGVLSGFTKEKGVNLRHKWERDMFNNLLQLRYILPFTQSFWKQTCTFNVLLTNCPTEFTGLCAKSCRIPSIWFGSEWGRGAAAGGVSESRGMCVFLLIISWYCKMFYFTRNSCLYFLRAIY